MVEKWRKIKYNKICIFLKSQRGPTQFILFNVYHLFIWSDTLHVYEGRFEPARMLSEAIAMADAVGEGGSNASVLSDWKTRWLQISSEWVGFAFISVVCSSVLIITPWVGNLYSLGLRQSYIIIRVNYRSQQTWHTQFNWQHLWHQSLGIVDNCMLLVSVITAPMHVYVSCIISTAQHVYLAYRLF